MRLLRADLDKDSAGADARRQRADGRRTGFRSPSTPTASPRGRCPPWGALVDAGLPLEIITDDQDFTHEWLREGQVLGCVTTTRTGAAVGRKVHGVGRHARGSAVAACQDFAAGALPPGTDSRTTSARFRSSRSTARTTCRRSSAPARSGLRRVATCASGLCPAPRARCMPRGCWLVWGASVVPHLQVHGLLASGDLVNWSRSTACRCACIALAGTLHLAAIDQLTQAWSPARGWSSASLPINERSQNERLIRDPRWRELQP